MANELRTRFNLVSGQLSAGISAVDTTITSAGLASLGVIDATNYAAIIIENEVMWVTAHTAASNTATVVRGKEGTSPAVHAVNTNWVHGPTVVDIEDGPYRPGDIKWTGRDDLPNGRWVWADGAEVLGTTYPQLAGEWGTGAGSRFGAAAVGNVKMPDLRRKFITMKAASGTGSTLGAIIGSNDAVSISHAHGASSGGGSNHAHPITDGAGAHQHTFGAANANGNGGMVGLTAGGSSYALMFNGNELTGSAGGHNHTVNGESAHTHGVTVNADGVSGTEKNIPEAVVCNAMVYVGLA